MDESLANRLIDAAERLYATHGLAGASLRQISAAAGTANNYAAQYHFGDVAGLVRAVAEKRMPEVERRRAELLSKAKAAGRLKDLRALNEALYRPLIEHSDAQGERWFGRFVLAVFSSPDGMRESAGAEQLSPVAEHILDLQIAANPAVEPALLRERHRLVVIMILMSVFQRADSQDSELDAAIIDNALDMATAALSAPVSKSARVLLKNRRAEARPPRRSQRRSPRAL